jgi:hypothetical protein
MLSFFAVDANTNNTRTTLKYSGLWWLADEQKKVQFN